MAEEWEERRERILSILAENIDASLFDPATARRIAEAQLLGIELVGGTVVMPPPEE